MTLRTIELGGIAVPFLARPEFEQSYEEIGGFHVLRMMNGAAVVQQHWTKLSTQVVGAGPVPPGLDGLDYKQPMTLKCAAERSFFSTSNAIALPVNRRADYAPIANAQLASGLHIPTPVALAGDIATATVVSGAVGYLFYYWPQLTVVVNPRPRMRISLATGQRAWEFSAEEV